MPAGRLVRSQRFLPSPRHCAGSFSRPVRRSRWRLREFYVVVDAAVSRVEFEVGSGTAVPTQLVLVPMLFALPASWVPLCAAAGYVLGHVLRRRPPPPGRAGRRAPLVLVVRRRPRARLRRRRRAAATFAAWPSSSRPSRRRSGATSSPPSSWSASSPDAARAILPFLAWVYLVDRRSPRSASWPPSPPPDPALAVLVLPLAGLLALFAARAPPRIDQDGRDAPGVRRARRSCSATSSRPTTRTPARTPRASSRSWTASAESSSSSRPDRDRAKLTALLHDVGKIASRRRSSTSRAADARGAGHHRDPHRRGRAILERVGGVLGEVGPPRPLLPRALGRQRLPGRPGGRGDPAGRPHRLRLRRLQRDDHRSLVPRRAPPAEASPSCAAAPAPSSTPRSSTRSSARSAKSCLGKPAAPPGSRPRRALLSAERGRR